MNPSGFLPALLQLQPLPRLSLKCLRKASIYRSLGVGERHMAESDWRHMSQPDWFAYVIAYTCEDCLCYHLHVRGCLCHLLHVH